MNQNHNRERERTERAEDAENPERAPRAERAARAVSTEPTENTGRPTLMHVTPGVTIPNISAEPLATEGEMSEGPARINPWRSERERQAVEQMKREKQAAQDDELYKTGSGEADKRGPRDSPLSNPPFAFGTNQTADLPGLELAEFEETIEIPDFDPFEYDGPQF